MDYDSYLTFGGASFRLLIPAVNQLAPRPRPALPGQWLNIPYGGSRFERPEGATLQTVWTPAGGILIPTTDDYTTIEALYGRFASLVTRWGTFNARLAQLDVGYFSNDGSYRGPASWEWA